MKDLPDVRSEGYGGLTMQDMKGWRLEVYGSEHGGIRIETQTDLLRFTRDQAEQLVEALRRLLAGEKIKP